MPNVDDVPGSKSAMGFPETHWTLLLEAGKEDPGRAAVALGKLCAVYREPILDWLLAAGLTEDQANDATQDLMHHLLAQGNLKGYQRERGRFRYYLLAILRNLLRDQFAARTSLKRGGHSLQVVLEPDKLAAPCSPPDNELDRGFARVVHARALENVRERWEQSNRLPRFAALHPYVFRRPSNGEYGVVARQLGMQPAQIKRSVFDLREDYFDAFREEVARLVVPEELGEEIRHLIGLLAEET